jgi:predicted porin
LFKKSIIAAAGLLALAGAAQAQVSIYGLIDVSYGKSFYSDLADRKAEFHSGGDNGSSEGNSTTRVGIKGAYDLGGGNKANFKFESGGITKEGKVTYDDIDCEFNGNCSQGNVFNRQAWFGLSGSYGEFRIGRQDSVPFQVMADFDFNGASNGVSAGAYSGVGVFNKGRQSGVLNYIAPAMGGLTAQFGFQPKGNRGAGAKDVFSAGVKYAAGPLAVGAAFQTKDATGLKDFVSVAGTYDFSVAKVMLGYADGGSASSGGTGKGLSAGISAPIAGFTVGAIVANNSDDAVKIKSYELFINREIFKNTYAYLEGGSWKSSTLDTKLSGYAAGIIFVF